MEPRQNPAPQKSYADTVFDAITQSKDPLHDIFSVHLIPALKWEFGEATESFPMPDRRELTRKMLVFVERGIAAKQFSSEEVNLRLYNVLLNLQGLVSRGARELLRNLSASEAKESGIPLREINQILERVLLCLHSFQSNRVFEEKNAFKNFFGPYTDTIFMQLQKAQQVRALRVWAELVLPGDDLMKDKKYYDRWMLDGKYGYTDLKSYYLAETKDSEKFDPSHLGVLSLMNMMWHRLPYTSEDNEAFPFLTLSRIGLDFASEKLEGAHLSYLHDLLAKNAHSMKFNLSHLPPPTFMQSARGGHPLAWIEIAKKEKDDNARMTDYAKAIDCLANAERFYQDPVAVSTQLVAAVLPKDTKDAKEDVIADTVLCKLVQHHAERNNINCLHRLLFEMPQRQRIEQAIARNQHESFALYLQTVPRLCRIFDIVEHENAATLFFEFSTRLLSKLNSRERAVALNPESKVRIDEAKDYKIAFPAIALRLAAYYLGYADRHHEDAASKNQNVDPAKATQWLQFLANFPGGIEYLATSKTDYAIAYLRPLMQQLPNIPPRIQQELQKAAPLVEKKQYSVDQLNERFNLLFPMLDKSPGLRFFEQSKPDEIFSKIFEIKSLVEEKNWDYALHKINLLLKPISEVPKEKEAAVDQKHFSDEQGVTSVLDEMKDYVEIVSVLEEMKKDISELKEADESAKRMDSKHTRQR